MVDNVDFEFTAPNVVPIIKSLFLVMISFLISIVGSIWLSSKLLTSGHSPLSPFVLSSTQQIDQGFIGVDNSTREMIGREGIADTILRPSGKVMIDDTVYDARSLTSYIEKGDKITVVRFEQGQLYVKKVQQIKPDKPKFA
jgi:membrane-bound serine protease (ClpP class)